MLIKRKNNPPNPLPRKMPSASPGKNPRFIVPVISIKTTGIPKYFGREKIPK
jgi:hypothetical protein